MELKKLKIKNVKRLGTTKVHDISVKDAYHYITENGVINHNSGPQYAASIILFLDKKQLKEGSGKSKLKTGIIIKAAPNKNRFAKPEVVETFLRYDKGMNEFTGLERFFNWEKVGVDKGIIDKKTGEKKPLKTAKTLIAQHLDYEITSATQLYSSEVFTQEVLEKIDEFAKPLFNYGINDEIPDEFISFNDDEDEEDIDIF